MKTTTTDIRKLVKRVAVFLMTTILILSTFSHALFAIQEQAEEPWGGVEFEQELYEPSPHEPEGESGGAEDYPYSMCPESGETHILPENGYEDGVAEEREEAGWDESEETHQAEELPASPRIAPRGGTGNVLGLVQDIGSDAIAGAIVSIIRLDGAGAPQTTLSAPNGSFSFTELVPGTYILLASAADHQPQQQLVTVTDGADSNVTVTLNALIFDRFLAVRVLAEGVNPINIEVRFNTVLMPLDGEVWGMPLSVAGSTGTLEVTLPGPVVITQAVSATDYDGNGIAFIIVDSGLGGTPPGDGVVRSSVSPYDPIDGAIVTLVNHDTFGQQQVITGADGTFSFPGALPGDYMLVVAAAGFNAAVVEEITITTGGPGVGGIIYLDPGTYTQALIVRPRTSDPMTPAGTAAEVDGDSLTRVQETWYIFLEAYAGDRTVTVTAPGYLNAIQLLVPASFANNKAFFDISLNVDTALPSGTIQGIVRDEGGLPLPGANVALVNTADASRMDAVTNSDGQYTFTGVAAGTYRLAFAATGRNAAVSANPVTMVAGAPGHHQADQTLLPGTNERVLLVHLDSSSWTSQNPMGTVVMLGSRSLVAPAIAATDNLWQLFSPVTGGVPGGIGQIDASAPNYEGEGEVLLVDYTDHNNIAVVSVEIEWSDVDLGLVPPRVVRGIVRDGAGANPPLQNVGVTLFDVDTGFRMDTRTNANGFYEFTDVPDGDYMLVFTTTNGAQRPAPLGNLNANVFRTPESFSINSTTGHRHDQSLLHTVNSRTARYLIVFGRDQSGNHLPGTTARMSWDWQPTNIPLRYGDRFHSSGHTGGGGAGVLTLNAPGRLQTRTVLTLDDYDGTGGNDLNGVAIVITNLDSDLAPPAPGYVEGFVWDTAGPLVGGTVVLIDVETGDRQHVTTNSDGFYRFTGVPHGEYHLIFGQMTMHTSRISAAFTLNAGNPGHRLDELLPTTTTAEQGYVFARFFDADGNRVNAGASIATTHTLPGLTLPTTSATNMNQHGPVRFWWGIVANTTAARNMAYGNLYTGTLGLGTVASPHQLQRGYHFFDGTEFDANNIAVIDIVIDPPPPGVVTGYIYRDLNNQTSVPRTAVLVNLETADIVRQQVGSDSSFNFTGVAPGHYRLLFTAQNRQPVMVGPFEVTASGHGLHRRHQFWSGTATTGMALFVHVVDKDGNNLAAQVDTLLTDNGAAGNIMNFTRPARLSQGLPDLWHVTGNRNPGGAQMFAQRVLAQVPGFFPTHVPFSVSVDMPPSVYDVVVVTIVMEEDDRDLTGNVIHGRVTIAGGIAVDRALVTVFNAETGAIFANVLTCSDGFYVVNNVPDGEYRLLFTANNNTNTAQLDPDLRAPLARNGIMPQQAFVMIGGPIEHNQLMVVGTFNPTGHMVRVQDTNGDPVPDARVFIGRWGNTGLFPGSGALANQVAQELTPLFGQTGDPRLWFRMGPLTEGNMIGLLKAEAPGFARGAVELGLTDYWSGPQVITITLEPETTRPARSVYGYFRSVTTIPLQNPAVVLLNLETGERRSYLVNQGGTQHSYLFDNVPDGVYRLIFAGDMTGVTRALHQTPIFTIDSGNLTHRYDRFPGTENFWNVVDNTRILHILLVDEHGAPLPDQNPAGLQAAWAASHTVESTNLTLSPGPVGSVTHGFWRTLTSRSAAATPGRLTVMMPGYAMWSELVWFDNDLEHTWQTEPLWESDVGVVRVHLVPDISPQHPPGTVYGRVTQRSGSIVGFGGQNIHLINLDPSIDDRDVYWRIMQSENLTGNFVFNNVPPGRYRIVFTGGVAGSSTTFGDFPPFEITASGPNSTHRQDNVVNTTATHPVIFYRLRGPGVESQRHPSPPDLINFGTRLSSFNNSTNNPIPVVGAQNNLWWAQGATVGFCRIWKPGFEAYEHSTALPQNAADWRFGVHIATIELTPEATTAPAGTITGQIRDTGALGGVWNAVESGGQWSTPTQQIALVNMDPSVPLIEAVRHTNPTVYGRYTFTNVPNGTWRVVIPNAQHRGTLQSQHPDALTTSGRVSAPIVVNNDGHVVHFDNVQSSAQVGNARILFARLQGTGAHGQHPPSTVLTLGTVAANVNLAPPDREDFFWHLGRPSTTANVGGGAGPLHVVSPGFSLGTNITVASANYVQGIQVIDLPMVAQAPAGTGTIQGHVRQSPGGVGSAVVPFNAPGAQAILVNVATGEVQPTGNAPLGMVDIDTTTGFYQFTGVPNSPAYQVVFAAPARHSRISTTFAIENNGIVVDESFMDSTNHGANARIRVLFAHLRGIGVDIQDLPYTTMSLRNTPGSNLVNNFLAPGVSAGGLSSPLWHTSGTGAVIPAPNHPPHATGTFSATVPGYHPVDNVEIAPANFAADTPGGAFVHIIPVTLTMDRDNPPPHTVRGFVFDGNASVGSLEVPLPGANVALINTVTGERRNETTNADGFFQFRSVTPGSYILAFTAAGRGSHVSDTFMVTPTDGYHYDVRLYAPPQGNQRMLLVRVISPYFNHTNPPAGLEITLGTGGLAVPVNPPGGNVFWYLPRNATGSGIQAGEGPLTASAPGFETATVSVTAANYVHNVALVTLTLNFEREPGSLTGFVRGQVPPTPAFPDGWQPLPGASVTAINQQTFQTFGPATAGSTGFYQFASLPPGRYILFASAPGHTTRMISGVDIPEGGFAVQDINLIPGAHGTVLYAVARGVAPSIVTNVRASDNRLLAWDTTLEAWYLEGAVNTLTVTASATGHALVNNPAAIDSTIYANHGILFVILEFAPSAQMTFRGNGGTTTHGVTGSDPPVSEVTLEAFVGATLGTAGTPVFTKPGHVFLRWNTAADGSGSDFDPITEPIAGNMTLYAQWANEVTVRLEVVDGRSPEVGIGSPVTTLDVPGGTPTPTLITVNGVGNGERIIPAADLPSTPVLSLTGINPNWFTVVVTRYDGVTPTGIPGSFNDNALGTAAVWTPTIPTQLAIVTSGQNVTFRVSISALTGPMMTISTPIDYGAHMINATGSETITLAGAHSAQPTVATNPTDVLFDVFHDNTGGTGWTLDVRAQAPASGPFAGNSQLSGRMYMEGSPLSSLPISVNARAATSDTLVSPVVVGPITTFNWANAGFTGVEVRTRPYLPPIVGEHQADMIWTLSPGVLP